MKDAFYFPHDSNAKDDPKCVLLIDQLGLEGYGIFWVLLETLRDQPGYKYPLALIPALARRYSTTAEKVQTVVKNYNLFKIENDELFFSESFLSRMQVIDNKREQARRAIQTRWNKYERNTDVLPTNNGCNTSKGKKSKGKDSKVKDKNTHPYNPLKGEEGEGDDNFKKFQSWINENAPNVGKMQQTFTRSEFLKIKEEYQSDFIQELLKEMHNWKDLLKKNVSANLTFRKWADKRLK